jgi:hypothetical protein
VAVKTGKNTRNRKKDTDQHSNRPGLDTAFTPVVESLPIA